jgi:hypothetical protein
MADINEMLRLALIQEQARANNFQPLTPEQAVALQRDAVSTEMPTWMEILAGGGLGGVAGRAVGRGMVRAGEAVSETMFPVLSGLAGPSAGRGMMNWAGRIGAGVGGVNGMDAATELARIRARQNTARDAEGQAGGFYGPASPMDAEGQPGGFYGNRPRR